MAFPFQTTVFGQLMRILSGNKLFRYPDEIDPQRWRQAIDPGAQTNTNAASKETTGDAEGQDGAAQNEPAQGEDGHDILLVGWYGPDDPENPHNWPEIWKHFITFQLCVLNFAVYIASSVYVPGEPGIIAEFGVSETVATLGLSLFTLGYGFGPMLWSPMSEMPRLGRSGIFFWTLLAFILFQLPVGFAPNIAVFLVFRWVTGFCGSPCLATAGGTIGDIYDPAMNAYMLSVWAMAGVCGPVFGPIVGGFLAPAKGWRWTIWVFTWLCSLVLISMFFFLPETTAANILYRRAKRIRQATGDERFKSQSEIDAAHHTMRDHLLVLGRAFTLAFFEPVVLLMNLYMGMLYGVLFLWFESFPLVFGDIYHFSSGEQGLAFLGIFVVSLITLAFYLVWLRYGIVPYLSKPNFKPEQALPPTFVGCFALPICLFWYGWTSRADIHWIVPIIGSGFFSIGVVTLFQSLFYYLGISYAQYAASIFAGAALFRATFGAVFPLFARQLFDELGLGPGNSLLGGIAILFIPGTFVFYRWGEKIRHMSKNARHDI